MKRRDCVTEVKDMGTYDPLTCSLKLRGSSGHLHSYCGWDFFLVKVKIFFGGLFLFLGFFLWLEYIGKIFIGDL